MAGVDERIGANLARIRGAVSQSDLAAAMREHGVKWSQTTVWEVEKGKRALKLSEAEVLAYVLDTPIELLLLNESGAEVAGRLFTWVESMMRYREHLRDAVMTYMDTQLELERALREAESAMASESTTNKKAIAAQIGKSRNALGDDAVQIAKRTTETYNPRSAYLEELAKVGHDGEYPETS